jgi:hypothetical protein
VSESRLVSVNALGFVDQGEVGDAPYRIDRDGRPYVPVGDGGVVRGLRLGDSAFAHVGDHAAPGACLVHPNADAGHALVGLACLGNRVEVRSGDAAGAVGAVLGKRGGGSRVIVVFTQEVLGRLRPGDQVSVATRGQGSASPLAGVAQSNASPEAVSLLDLAVRDERLEIGVRVTVPSRLVGNGVGRPTVMWDLDLQLDETSGPARGVRLGDLVAIGDLDARTNAGYRRGWTSVGVVVHGASAQPGHGPGVTVIFSGPTERFSLRDEHDAHQGLSEERLLSLAGNEE